MFRSFLSGLVLTSSLVGSDLMATNSNDLPSTNWNDLPPDMRMEVLRYLPINTALAMRLVRKEEKAAMDKVLAEKPQAKRIWTSSNFFKTDRTGTIDCIAFNQLMENIETAWLKSGSFAVKDNHIPPLWFIGQLPGHMNPFTSAVSRLEEFYKLHKIDTQKDDLFCFFGSVKYGFFSEKSFKVPDLKGFAQKPAFAIKGSPERRLCLTLSHVYNSDFSKGIEAHELCDDPFEISPIFKMYVIKNLEYALKNFHTQKDTKGAVIHVLNVLEILPTNEALDLMYKGLEVKKFNVFDEGNFFKQGVNNKITHKFDTPNQVRFYGADLIMKYLEGKKPKAILPRIIQLYEDGINHDSFANLKLNKEVFDRMVKAYELYDNKKRIETILEKLTPLQKEAIRYKG